MFFFSDLSLRLKFITFLFFYHRSQKFFFNHKLRMKLTIKRAIIYTEWYGMTSKCSQYPKKFNIYPFIVCVLCKYRLTLIIGSRNILFLQVKMCRIQPKLQWNSHVLSTSNVNLSLYTVKCKSLRTAYFDLDFTRSLFSYLCPRATVTLSWVPEYISTFLAIFHKYTSFYRLGSIFKKTHRTLTQLNLWILSFLTFKSLWLTEKYWFQNDFV